MNYVTVISSEINNFKQRVVKFLRLGKNDTQTSLEASAYGVDSNPIKGMKAIYAPTMDKGSTVIIGYINKNQKAGVGEFRTFATDADGAEKFYMWLKADGTSEIGGNTNFAVKYNQLQTAYNQLKTDHNNLGVAVAAHTAAVALILGTPVYVFTPSTGDITPAKNDKIKTIG